MTRVGLRPVFIRRGTGYIYTIPKGLRKKMPGTGGNREGLATRFMLSEVTVFCTTAKEKAIKELRKECSMGYEMSRAE